jgi:hypothetical protein
MGGSVEVITVLMLGEPSASQDLITPAPGCSLLTVLGGFAVARGSFVAGRQGGGRDIMRDNECNSETNKQTNKTRLRNVNST